MTRSLASSASGVAVYADHSPSRSHQHERAFSASLIYLGLGLFAPFAIEGSDLDGIEPVGDAELLERSPSWRVIIALFATA